MISHKYKCIYLHIPKTAGSSIEKKLEHFDVLCEGVQDHRSIKCIEPLPIQQIIANLSNGNDGYSRKAFLKYHLQQKLNVGSAITSEQYQQYFKFTFVRNPWARAYSWYRNVMKSENKMMRLGIKNEIAFSDFIKNYPNQFELRPQTHWIYNNKGNIPLDFIGKFERLDEDFRFICDRLQLPDPTLPQILIGGNDHYTEHYDESTINLVYKMYKHEIDLFEYEYGV